MRKITVPVLNILLAAGVALILAGLLLISFTIGSIIPVKSIVTMIFGSVIFYFALAVFHWATLFFSGLFLFGIGLFSTFVFSGMFPFASEHLWPIYVLLCGVCLILTCIFKHKKVRVVYLFPAILIEVLGVFFLLFSIDIIKISFAAFISRWFPLILIFLGGSLVVLFLCQRNFNDIFPYNTDELADSTDEKDVLGED